MSDSFRKPTLARKAGRGFLRALAGLFGKPAVGKARDSMELLREEFREGRKGDARSLRAIPHREKGSLPLNEGGAPPRVPEGS